MFIKLYSKKPLILGKGWGTSDEEEFDYETFFSPDKIGEVSLLPAGASFRVEIGFSVKGFVPTDALYPMLVKAYDGRESPTRTNFYLKFKD
jgi:hypothetical protein